jgi:hypothetical protein
MAKNTWYKPGTYYAAHRDEQLAKCKARHHQRNVLTATRPKPDRCELCGRAKRLVFEHCHVEQRFRGWVCYGCNILLGKVEIVGVRKIVAYLGLGK